MEKPNPCTLCGRIDFRVIHKKDPWKYLCCRNCSLVLLHPQPTAQILMDSYRNYLPANAEEIRKWKTMMKPVYTKSAELIESRTRTGKGKLLDIGCGHGFFLQEMQSRGWDVTGIELSRKGREYAQAKLGIKVHSEPLANISYSKGTFDVVTFIYVIEHMPDPIGLLMEVKRILKPNGLVLLRWPHSTPIVKILGPVARKLDLYHTPYHLHDFSPKTIETLLLMSGFQAVETCIGGHTRPLTKRSQWITALFGQMGETLYSFSGGYYLLPGISKTTLAFK